jgi:hypothetical protein
VKLFKALGLVVTIGLVPLAVGLFIAIATDGLSTVMRNIDGAIQTVFPHPTLTPTDIPESPSAQSRQTATPTADFTALPISVEAGISDNVNTVVLRSEPLVMEATNIRTFFRSDLLQAKVMILAKLEVNRSVWYRVTIRSGAIELSGFVHSASLELLSSNNAGRSLPVWTLTPTQIPITFEAIISESVNTVILRSAPSVDRLTYITTFFRDDLFTASITVDAKVNTNTGLWYHVVLHHDLSDLEGYIHSASLELVPSTKNPNAILPVIALTPSL